MKRFFCLVALASAFVMAASAAGKARAGHVIVIGLDGWGAYSVPKSHDIPNIQSAMQNGCYTLHKRCVLKSESAINWASMFNGAPTEMHGYTNWNSRVPEVPSLCTNSRGIYPTIFSLLRDQRPKAVSGCIAEWDGIKYVVDSAAINNVDVAWDYETDDTHLCRMAEKYIKEAKPTLLAVCFDQIDHVGHEIGHDTPAYYDKVASIDVQIGRIIQATKDAGIYDDTVFLITADHGGIGRGHGGQTLLEMEIPYIIFGKGIKHGMEITETVIQYDTAATIAEILGLERPQCWRGLPTYSVFESKRK
jgi:hypothetical protein